MTTPSADDSEKIVQDRLDEAMPWIGMYIAASSAVCTLAMAVATFNGFRSRKFWFPCKYFSLNATSLTLLAVAMKLPLDFTTRMWASYDWLAKLSTLIFMSTAMGNFAPSLGSMDDKEILTNVIALSILVITIVANVWIQNFQLQTFIGNPIIMLNEVFVACIFMLLLLVNIVSSAMTVPVVKILLESKFRAMHEVAVDEEGEVKYWEERERFRVDRQRGILLKHMMMAETSNPQFVIERSVVCVNSSVITMLAAFTLVYAHISYSSVEKEEFNGHTESVYGKSTTWILVVHTIGVAIGTIAPTLRWFVAAVSRRKMTDWNSCKKGFKIEAYWTQTLVDWRGSFSSLQIGQNKCRKYIHDVKWFALTFCIGVQILIVKSSKLIASLSALLIIPLFLCYNYFKKQRGGHEASGDKGLNLNGYVLVLEGEAELPRRALKNICREADKITESGKKKQPQNLVSLLRKSVNFNGVGEFDSNQIPSLHSQEPTNCWTLPVVTLTSIAIALPNIATHERNQLLISVREGLSLAKIVEKTLVKNAQLVNYIRKSADICWVGVLLYMKWMETDLKKMSLKCKNAKALLQALSDKAEEIIMEFKKKEHDPIMENPLNWPNKVVIANSMYRISRTTLLWCEEENALTDEELFERLCVMIADILAACLTNLPHAITTMCQHRAIEKRGESVREAFLLLGKTEQVLEVLLVQQQEWPSLDHDEAARIQEWRALFR